MPPVTPKATPLVSTIVAIEVLTDRHKPPTVELLVSVLLVASQKAPALPIGGGGLTVVTVIVTGVPQPVEYEIEEEPPIPPTMNTVEDTKLAKKKKH